MRPLGRTRIQRLLFLASQSPALRKPCSEAALHLITSSTKDVNAYHQALALRNTTAHHDQAALPRDQRLPADTAWIESTERSNRAESQKLDLELRNYTNNLIKESIRMAHRDLGDHMRATGNLTDALKCYMKTRDYCSTSEDVVEMCINVIEVSLELQQYGNIATYVSKAEGLLDSYNPNAATSSSAKASGSGSVQPASKGGTTSGADAIGALFRAGGSAGQTNAATVSALSAQLSAGGAGQTSAQREAEVQSKKQIANIAAKLNVAQGIAALGQGRYAAAAKCFLVGDSAAPDAYTSMASRADVALYATLCSLAMYDRKRVRTEVVERPNLGAFLEHEPQTRELLDSFYACEYKKTLELLDRHEARYLVDVHLARHYLDLRRSITDRALLQFVQPFDAVKLERIEQAIWSDEHGGARAANKVLDLIQQGRIDGKIDWIAKVVNVRKPNVRQDLFEEALKSGQERMDSARRLVFRMSLVQNGWVTSALFTVASGMCC
ncbi:hypothetical protein L7F22_030717 [Adiantum nelumboides]|nr:hypothetical protein [Adiantum nelumboides]